MNWLRYLALTLVFTVSLVAASQGASPPIAMECARAKAAAGSERIDIEVKAGESMHIVVYRFGAPNGTATYVCYAKEIPFVGTGI
jgi:hypothetical protein